MNRFKRITKTMGHILFASFCCLLLAFLLYSTQIFAVFFLNLLDADAELTMIQNSLDAEPQQDDVLEMIDELYKQNLQKATLMLSGNTLSDEKLAATAEYLIFADSMLIYKEDGTLLYSYGKPVDDPSFLSGLQNNESVKDTNGCSYRSILLQDGLHLAIGMDLSLFEMDYRQSQYAIEIVENLAPGLTYDVMVAMQNTDRLVYGPESIIGKKLSDHVMYSANFDPMMYMLVIDNSIKFAVVREYDNYQLLSLIDISTILNSLDIFVIPAFIGFGLLIVLLLAYLEFIRTDMRKGRLGKIHYAQLGKKHYLNTVLLRKMVGFGLIGIFCMTCIIYCLQLLIRSDEHSQNAEDRLDIAARILEEYQMNLAEIEEMDQAYLVTTAEEIKSILAFNQSLLSEDGLNSISRNYDINDIHVLNEAGKTVFSTLGPDTFTLSSNSADSTYVFWDVISRFEKSHVQTVLNDPYSHGKDMLYIGIPADDGRGLLLITFPYDVYQASLVTYGIETPLQKIGIDSQSTLLAVPKGSTACIFDSSNQYLGLSLSDYGLDDAFLRNGYSGTHRFDEEDCLITTRSVLDWNLIYITPLSFISFSSWIFTVLSISISLLFVAITIFPRMVVRTPGDDIHMLERKPHSVSHRSHFDAHLTRDGKIELEESHVEYHTLRMRWAKMVSSEKLIYLIRTLLVVFGAYLLFFVLFSRNSDNHPLLDRVLEQNWDHSLNVYALTYVLISLAVIWFAAKILRTVTMFVMSTFDRRWKTLGILISNIIRYSALIVSIFFTLQNFGVETSTLVTSASVLTLVFGLGCQSFVADLVAGIFLIFEGTFRVGDIVTVDNWRGEVIEIGLRSTSVKNELGNVKVFQNSRISGAINMTRDMTFAVCDITLPASEPLEAFEEKLNADFFPTVKQHIPNLRHPLMYEGVVAISGNSATLRISVRCLESDREQIKRDLYRALKLWQEKN